MYSLLIWLIILGIKWKKHRKVYVMEKKVGFKLHKVKKNWVTIGVSTLSMVALAGGAFFRKLSK